MRYEGAVFRPPSEGNSVIIQATVGCPHNRCNFCNMYKEKRFRIRKVEDILEDIEMAGQAYNPQFVKTLFLADGNTVIMRTPHLLQILHKIREVFPYLERVTSYGASQYMALKSHEEWKELYEKKEHRVVELDSKIDQLYAEKNEDRQRIRELTEKNATLEIEKIKLEVKRCDVRGCSGRKPPSDY